MKTPKWFCIKCKQPLTRKWNALRHCDNKHDGFFEYIIPFSEYLKKSNTIKDSEIYGPNIYDNRLLVPQEKLFFNEKTTISNTQPSLKTIQDKKDDYTQKEILLSSTLDKIAPKYEDINNLLSHLSEANRRQMVGNIICAAIYDDDPLRYINKQIKNLRKYKLHNLMLEDVSIYLVCNKHIAKEYLKMGLKEDSLD